MLSKSFLFSSPSCSNNVAICVWLSDKSGVCSSLLFSPTSILFSSDNCSIISNNLCRLVNDSANLLFSLISSTFCSVSCDIWLFDNAGIFAVSVISFLLSSMSILFSSMRVLFSLSNCSSCSFVPAICESIFFVLSWLIWSLRSLLLTICPDWSGTNISAVSMPNSSPTIYGSPAATGPPCFLWGTASPTRFTCAPRELPSTLFSVIGSSKNFKRLLSSLLKILSPKPE